MTTRNELISLASALVASGLMQAGMQKRKRDIFTRELEPGFLGWVGLNRAFRRKERILEINPVIGVRHQPTEELLASLLDEKFHPYQPATISISLGYLTPERRYRSWLFNLETPQDPVAQDLVAKVRDFAYPFMTAHSTLAAVIKAMESNTGASDFAYRVPIAYLLEGNLSKAKTYLIGKCAELGNAEYPYSIRYKAFASRFLEFAESTNIRALHERTSNNQP